MYKVQSGVGCDWFVIAIAQLASYDVINEDDLIGKIFQYHVNYLPIGQEKHSTNLEGCLRRGVVTNM